jgi:hypothetical protein
MIPESQLTSNRKHSSVPCLSFSENPTPVLLAHFVGNAVRDSRTSSANGATRITSAHLVRYLPETDRSRCGCPPSRDAGGWHLSGRTLVQRVPARSLLLEASGSHRMTATAQARGAWCWQCLHHNHIQGVDRCSSPSVGGGPDRRMADNPAAGWLVRQATLYVVGHVRALHL